MDNHDVDLTARRRMAAYCIVGLGLVLGYATMRGSTWTGSAQLHTVMEAVATLLAVIIGAMALVRFYAKKNNTFLFIGTGFLGTAFLDGYHTIVTSAFFRPFMPSDLPALIPWSWVASRQFLSILMFLSVLAWLREQRLGESGRISEKTVYVFAALFTLASFLFFAFVPLPRAYYPEIIFHRPEEFLPAMFFAMALVGYLRKGEWRRDAFEHWLVLSLIVGFISQAVFMSFSGQLFDLEFDAAHTLKKVSYICVLIGLMANMSEAFRRVIDDAERIRVTVDSIVDGIITIDEFGVIQSVNPATERIFGYGAVEMLGRNISMLAAEPYRGAHDGYIANYRDGGAPQIIGLGREVEGQRKNGAVFPMELTVAEMWIAGEKMYLGVTRDITDRKSMERVKDEFVSTVSHELRTPLTSITGSLGLIRSSALDKSPEKTRELIDIAHTNSERLVRLINDILDIEKIQAGFVEDAVEPVDLMALIVSAVAANKGFSRQYGVRFVFVERVEEAHVLVNRDRLIQVMTNLLSNAVKNSPTGGYIDISVLRQGDKVRVEVTDQGAGIPEAFQSCIFQKFAQADSSDNRQKGGTGLGLSICKAIIERYDGVIGFDTKEGVGTTFYFELPLMEMAAGQIDSRVAEGQGSHVLICEDDPDIAQLIDVLLQADGYVTDIAYCAAQAKAMLKSNNYAAMTLDLCLPDQDGISLIGDLRADEATRHLPIIVVSIKAEEGKKQLNGDAFGIIDWMVKPIDPDRLRDDLKRALQYSSGKKPRILHVEDDPDICKIITMIIGDEADVITATTLKDATSILKDGRFDLVILDLMLPDGSGEELLPLINRPGRPSTPVIVFSANQVTMETAKQVSAVLVKSRTTNQELANIIRAHTTPLNSLGSAP